MAFNQRAPLLDEKGNLRGYRGADTTSPSAGGRGGTEGKRGALPDLVENIEDIVYVADGAGSSSFSTMPSSDLRLHAARNARKNYMEILTPSHLKSPGVVQKQKKDQNVNVGVFEMSFFDKDGTVKTLKYGKSTL